MKLMTRAGVVGVVAAAAMLLLGGCVGFPGAGYPSDGYGYPDGNYPGNGYPNDGYYGSGRVVRCESPDFKQRRCDADTRGGVRLTRQISNTQCVQGRNWGYDNRGIWVNQGCAAEFALGTGGYNPGYGGQPGYGQTLRCESPDFKQRRCDADTSGGVRLTRQISNTQCVQGRNWGYDNRGVWVNQGCAAEFTLGAGGYDPGYGGQPGYGNGQTLRCESNDGRPRRCNANVRSGVDLIRQLSKTRCVQGQTWGWDRGGVWVQNGCRGEFRIR